MQQETNLRNLVLAMVAIMGIMFVWETFILGPQREAQLAAQRAEQAELEKKREATIAVQEAEEEAALIEQTAQDVRVSFDAPSVDGSILLRGARLDQLNLKNFFETLDDKKARNADGEIKIFEPQGLDEAHYALIGWRDGEGGSRITDAQTNWSLASGSTLTPTSPITLQYQTGSVTISRVVSVDDNFMFTMTDTVTNTSARELALQPYGILRQFGKPSDLSQNTMILHEGFVGATGNKLHMLNYKKLEKGNTLEASTSEGGWVGLTDKYWLGAIIPEQDKPFSIGYRTINRDDGQVFQARMDGTVRLVGPGETITSVNRVYGGAKQAKVLRAYQKELGIPRFEDAIDWGKMFFWLTKPFFMVLTFINGYVGNFGVSILILTVLVKAIFFPVANRAYKSLAVMRDLAEPMKEIRETITDKAEQQKRVMELYKEKKVNPVAGCLPMLLQMPVFYGLYKTLFVTIEMRHEPFFGYVQDLSAPDPTHLINLFGLLPFDADPIASIPLVGLVLGIGFLPILYGLTMWFLQSLNPPPQDEMQRMVFAFLPLIFTFIFAGFAAGLVIYWVWSNFLTILQQYTIMRQNGTKTELDKFIEKRILKRGDSKE